MPKITSYLRRIDANTCTTPFYVMCLLRATKVAGFSISSKGGGVEQIIPMLGACANRAKVDLCKLCEGVGIVKIMRHGYRECQKHSKVAGLCKTL